MIFALTIKRIALRGSRILTEKWFSTVLQNLVLPPKSREELDYSNFELFSKVAILFSLSLSLLCKVISQTLLVNVFRLSILN